MSQLDSVLITGCSAGGIGYELALEFQRRGLHVFATARNPDKMKDLAEMPNVTLLQLDVADQASITKAAADLAETTGGKLRYLINNAGAQYVAPILDTPLAEAKKLFDINVFGVMLTCQAFAPLLVAAGGCIVNVCSISGHLHTPWMGMYQASKAATEMMSETLRLELLPLGVRVISLITGAVDTNIMKTSPKDTLPDTSYYKFKEAETAISKLTSGNDGVKRTPREVFAKQVVGDILVGTTGKIWRGQIAFMVSILSKFMPASVLDSTLLGNSGLKGVSRKP
ncbi:hypothetical protein DL765_009119 [Monosporascus sp. GIB2]|nr:hypothetical protein DL765_009119 [Monosporascus sp. GIB2]